MSQLKTDNLYERYEAVMAHQQRQQQEDNRSRLGMFTSAMETYVDDLCAEYFYMAQQPVNPRLRELLMTAHMQKGEIKLARYAADGTRRYFLLSEKNISTFFAEERIFYEPEAALLLLTRIRALQHEASDTLFKRKLDRFRQLSHQCSTAADLILEMESHFSWHDGHLIFLDPIQHKPFSGSDIVNTDFLPLSLPKAQNRKLFRYLAEKLKSHDRLLRSDEATFLETIDTEGAEVVYSFFGQFYSVKHSADGTSCLTGYKAKPRHSVKHFRLYGKRSGDKAAEILRTLCGGNVNMLDLLARLFSDIAVPATRAARLSVVYTRSNAAFIGNLLNKVFSADAPASVNSLLTSKGKVQLMNKQLQGEPLLLISDKAPSQKRMADFVALISGDKLETECEVLGKQSFHSRLHVVCVTDNISQVRHFVSKYGADVINLSPYEHICDPAMLNGFGVEDGEWFKTVFTIHGCKVRAVAKAKSNRRTTAKISHQEIGAFIKARCKISKRAVCERDELYKAYCEYYETLHGCPPNESSVVFGKRFRENLPSGIEYKVKRYGAGNSTHLCYVGLGIDPDKSSFLLSPTENAFDSQLADMEQHAAQLLQRL